jgi:hypothetical protein
MQNRVEEERVLLLHTVLGEDDGVLLVLGDCREVGDRAGVGAFRARGDLAVVLPDARVAVGGHGSSNERSSTQASVMK